MSPPIKGRAGVTVNLVLTKIHGVLQLSLAVGPILTGLGLLVSDPDCYAGGRGFDSHPGQMFV